MRHWKTATWVASRWSVTAAAGWHISIIVAVIIIRMRTVVIITISITTAWWRRHRRHLTVVVWLRCSLSIWVVHHSVLTEAFFLRSSSCRAGRFWTCNSTPLCGNATDHFAPLWTELFAGRFHGRTFLPATFLWHDIATGLFLMFLCRAWLFLGGSFVGLCLFGNSMWWVFWRSAGTPWCSQFTRWWRSWRLCADLWHIATRRLVAKQHSRPTIDTSNWWCVRFPSFHRASNLFWTRLRDYSTQRQQYLFHNAYTSQLLTHKSVSRD